MTMKNNALLTAFERLFDKAARKLNVTPTEEDRDEVKQQFSERFADAIRLVEAVNLKEFPEAALTEMEGSIDELSPSQVAGYVAAGPIAVRVQELHRAITLRVAQDKMIEHMMTQADDRYGGN